MVSIAALHTSVISKSTFTTSIDNFRHPILTSEELHDGGRLGIDTWADTSCAGKHAYVEEFIEGASVTATGFTHSLGKLENLPIANVVYAYDYNDGTTILLENNNAIYLGDAMNDSLLNPIQSEENDVRIDIRPRRYYPNDPLAQTVTFSDGTTLPVLYDGVLPYLPVRRPTANELDSCRRLEISSRYKWDPYVLHGSFSQVSHDHEHDPSFIIDELQLDPISCHLHSIGLHAVLSSEQLITAPQDSDEYSTIYALKSRTSSSITPEALSRGWHIGLSTALRTLKATTHEHIRSTGLLSKRFRTDKSQLRYKQLSRRYGTFYCDYLKATFKSVRGFIGGVLYTNKQSFKKFFPCTSETSHETGRTIRSFIDIIGLPYSIHSDNHSNFKEGLFKKLMRKFGILQSFTEPHSPWQNRAEPAIGELKRHARKLMQSTRTPVRLWCFCYEYTADLLSLCATGSFELQGRTPYETVLHSTPDISEYVSFTWFQWCYYFDETMRNKRLCRWLGPAHQVGQSFCSYLLLDSADHVARSSVIPVPDEDLQSPSVQQQMKEFMISVEDKIGNHRQPSFDFEQPDAIYHRIFDDDDPSDDENVLPYGSEILDAKTEEIDSAYLESMDEYIGAQVVVPGHDNVTPVLATVKRRKRDHHGDPVGIKNDNPILDTRVYQLEFPDGRIDEYSVNVIAENLMSQVDDDGWDTGILKEVVSFRRDPEIAVSKENGSVHINGIARPVITTKGWDVQVSWIDGSTSWVPLKLMKESNPVEVAEYAVANGYHQEPAFKWWVNHVLKKRDRLINKVKVHCRKAGRTKFGIEVPRTVEEALALDRKNNNTLWQDAITKEMKNSRCAFELLSRDAKAPVGFKKITCHLVFDIKLDLTRKARYVAGGHLTDPPTSMTYSSVVTRESVRIAFLVAALNGLSVLAGDVQNAYLNAPTKEKIYFIAGNEWKADEGKVVVIVRALYGLKSSALQWRNHISDVIGNKLGFKSSLADPDVWYKASSKPDGTRYYAYILVYVDDILIIDINPEKYMSMLKENYTVRDSSIGPPTTYLGADVGKINYPDGTYAWTMSSNTYVKEAIRNVKKRLEEDGFIFNKKLSDKSISCPQPFSSLSYRPELDTSAECTPEQSTYYQNLIGVLRWIVELGRIDIAFEVSCLSRHLVQPRTGHLVQALHIFKYLDIHHDNALAFDPAYHNVDDPAVVERRVQEMKSAYADAQEDLPPNAPVPLGNPVEINMFVDADHASDQVTRRSQTGILIYCNSAPIIWYSKKQTTVESSTFGSEFVALRIATELLISLRYKLRMFGIPITGPASVFCDNESVYKNVASVESTLKKKHNSICFHRVRESIASGICVVYKVGSDYNLADMLTKSLPPEKRKFMRSKIMVVD